MPTKPSVIYWDSCVFIDTLQKTPGRYEDLRKILSEAQNGTVVIVTSTVTLTEVHFFDRDPTKELAEQAEQIRAFFESDFIELWPLDRSVAEDAACICRDHALHPLDAIHLATAQKTRCRCFYTYDGKRNKRRKKGLLSFDGRIGTPPLRIETPDKFFSSRPLFDNLPSD